MTQSIIDTHISASTLVEIRSEIIRLVTKISKMRRYGKLYSRYVRDLERLSHTLYLGYLPLYNYKPEVD